MGETMTITKGARGYELSGKPLRDFEWLQLEGEQVCTLRRFFDSPTGGERLVPAGTLAVVAFVGPDSGLVILGTGREGDKVRDPIGVANILDASAQGWRFRRVPPPEAR